MKTIVAKYLTFCLTILSILVSSPLRMTAKSQYIFRTINITDGLPDNYIRKIVADSAGYIYISTDKGICRYDGYRVSAIENTSINNNSFLTELKRPYSTTHASTKSTLIDRKGNVWIYDPFGYGIRCDSDNKKLFEKCIIKDVAVDTDGKLWIATNNSGIFILNTDNYQYENLLHDSSNHTTLPTNHTTCVYIDSISSTVWVGTSKNGVAVASLHIPEVTVHKSEVQQEVSCFSFMPDGNFLIGYDGGGLLKNDNKKIDLPIDVVTNLLYDEKENITYIATYGKGIYCLNGNKVYSLSNCGDNSPVAFSRQLYKDSEGNLWIGTFSNGIIRRSVNGDLQQFLSKNYPIGSNCIVGIEAYGNKLYVASSAAVSTVDLSTLKFKRLNTPNNINIRYFRVDKNGKPWIATENYLLVPGNIKLPLAHTRAMIFDKTGNCWLTTSDGMNVVIPSKSNDKHYKYYHFPANTDAKSNVFSKYAIYRKNNGNICAGMFGGYVEFNPKSLLELCNSSVNISSISINSSPAYVSENILINSKDTICINLTSLNYLVPNSGRFAYRLLPDTTIIPIDNANLTLKDIPAGTYKLQLIELNSGDTDEIDIEVKNMSSPAIYFIVILVMVIIAGGACALYFRNKRQNNISSETVSLTDKLFLEKLNSTIENELANIDFTIEMFASEMGMSRSNLYKKVSQLTGLSPLEYLRDKRIERGKKMLDEGHSFISQVAYSVGLSPKQFSKFFKEQFGCLPSEYIKSNK